MLTSTNNLMLTVDEEIEDYKENQLDQSVEMGEVQASFPYYQEYQKVQPTSHLPTSRYESHKFIKSQANSQRSLGKPNQNSIMVYYLVKRFLTKLSLARRQKLFFKSQHFQIVGDKASQKNESLGELLHNKRINNLKQKQLKYFTKLADKLIASIYNIQRQLPIIYPQSITKIIIDIILCIVTVSFLIMIPIDLAFDTYLMSQDAAVITIPFLIFLTFNYFVKMNTVYFENGQPIKDKGLIFLNYLKNGLIIDGVTILVLIFEFFNSNYIQSKYAQLMQLIFLTQFPYFSKIIRNIEESIHMSKTQSAMLNLAKLILTLLYFLHIFSCCWFFIGNYMNNQGEANWLDFRGLGNFKASEQYLDAFYFSTVTMISVGYGDIVPQNYLEKLCTIIFMFTSSIQLSFSVNTVGEILNSITLSSENTTEKIRIINKFMNQKKIRFDLQYQIREYIKIYWSQQMKEESDEESILIQSLSENLRSQLIYESNNATIQNCKLFKDTFSAETQIQLVQLLKTVFIQPEQQITSELSQFEEQCLCFIEEGELNLFSKDSGHSKIVRFEKGQYFGLDEFLTGKKSHLQLKSQSFVKLQVLLRSEFLQTIAKNSKDYEQFCRIRDQLQLEEIQSKEKCMSCNCYGHDIWNCPIVHFVADKERVIKKHQFLQNQQRSYIIRSERQKNLFSALSDQWLLSEISHGFQNQNDNPLVKFYNIGVTQTIQKEILETHTPLKSQSKVNFFGQISMKSDNGKHRRAFRHASIKVKNSTIRLKFQKVVKKLIKLNQINRNFWAQKNGKNSEKQFNEMMMYQVKEYFQTNQIEDILSKQEFENLQFLRIKGEMENFNDQEKSYIFEVQKEYQFYFTHNNLISVIPKHEPLDLNLRSSMNFSINTIHRKSPYLPPDMLYNALKKSLIHYLQFPILYFEKFHKIRFQDKKKLSQLKVQSARALFQKLKSHSRRSVMRQNALPQNVRIGRIVPQQKQ